MNLENNNLNRVIKAMNDNDNFIIYDQGLYFHLRYSSYPIKPSPTIINIDINILRKNGYELTMLPISVKWECY